MAFVNNLITGTIKISESTATEAIEIINILLYAFLFSDTKRRAITEAPKESAPNKYPPLEVVRIIPPSAITALTS